MSLHAQKKNQFSKGRILSKSRHARSQSSCSTLSPGRNRATGDQRHHMCSCPIHVSTPAFDPIRAERTKSFAVHRQILLHRTRQRRHGRRQIRQWPLRGPQGRPALCARPFRSGSTLRPLRLRLHLRRRSCCSLLRQRRCYQGSRETGARSQIGDDEERERCLQCDPLARTCSKTWLFVPSCSRAKHGLQDRLQKNRRAD
ncbi:hypothetical protein BV25DRAFT_1573415 [Artomyces pyxidatus]|uniref:Uncharacterized protein n=1 Tax=Artomyces pyxidatus TaxID=48021 RepID=A0ACB8SKY1_9AGAM|nr:hypothetical protein BV25DRAFT_1573415 [Artomyces pyxidatus]